jgi:sugar lactone lactonase YvrE
MKKLITFRSISGAVAIAVLLVSSRAQGAPGDLYVAEGTGGGHIYKFTPAGSKSTFASGFYQPVALAFDRAGNLFVGNSGSGANSSGPSTISRITLDGTQTMFATLPSSQLSGMAFDGAGNLFVSNGSNILKITPDGTQSNFASQPHGIGSLAFDMSGYLYAQANDTGPNSILKFAPDGNSTTFVTFPAPDSAITALAFGGPGDLFLIRGGSILKIRPDGSSTTFAKGDFQSNSLAFDTSGTLFAGQYSFNSTDPAIIKFTPTGTATTFASGFLLPSAFAFEPVREKVRNISARGLVANGDNVLIGGFIVGGSALANNAVVVRAIGPSLSRGGVSNPLSDPVLELHDSSGAIIASNNDWQDTQKAQITASGLAPTDPRESAIFATLPAGNYTGVVLSGDHTAGIALVEIYSVNE